MRILLSKARCIRCFSVSIFLVAFTVPSLFRRLFGEGALSALEESRIDLVLLDYILPDTDGLEVLRKLRRKQAGLPVILISAYATSETIGRASALGMTGFVKKPFGVDDVLEQIARALEKTRGQARPTRAVEPVDPYITSVVSYLRSHLWEKLSCEKLLEIAHLSRPTFCRRFKNSKT